MESREHAMTEQWIYETSADGSSRFVLGVVGTNPLICFGINPSTAKPGALDPTVTRVKNFAAAHGYDGWTMLNIYPQISTDPAGMHRQCDPQLKALNEQHITVAIHGRPTVLAAWGENMTRRPYLSSLLRDILKLTDASGARWLSLGTPTKAGHPRHPSRLANATPFVPFDMSAYRWAR